jgi:zinc transport system ATP-binding protein
MTIAKRGSGAAQPNEGSREGPAVRMRGVSFRYSTHDILTDVDLELPRRSFASVIGPNGGGKTTLLKLLLGLIQPDRGTIEVLGRSAIEARPKVGYTPQHSQADPTFPARVIDVVLMGRLSSGHGVGGYTGEDKDAAAGALETVELCHLAGRPFSELSGGQRQRTLIARALASRPELLLLDEPTANLDVHMEEELHGVLHKLQGSMAIMLVTHDIGFVSHLADTAVCVKGTVAVHPTSEVTSELIQQMYESPVRFVHHDRSEPDGEEGSCRSF